MNREIKFRAWDKKNSKWAKIQEWSESGVNATIFDGRSIPNLVLHSDNFYEWSQFTGLKDKNGKEVYEGDIVRCVSNMGDNCLHSVIWEAAEPFSDMGGFNLMELLPGAKYDWIGKEEIVGNIYENPELLKQ